MSDMLLIVSKVKIEINYVLVKFIVNGEDVLSKLHIKKYYFVDMRRIASYLPKKICVCGIFQLACYSP